MTGIASPFERGLDQTLAEITEITLRREPTLRNLQITQRYADLSRALGAVIGDSNANWSTFATWASKTAGQSIRGEEVPREVLEALNEQARFKAEWAKLTRPVFGFVPFDLELFDLVRAIITEVSQQIAEGNLKVFRELAPVFARFSFAFQAPENRTEQEFALFLGGLKDGPPETDGQSLLKEAFGYYFRAASSESAKERAELTLHGSILIGLHEQTRLQSNIEGGIDAPVSPRVYDQFKGGIVFWLRPLLRLFFHGRWQLFHSHLEETWERIATRFFMRLSLPHGKSVSLGEDIPLRRGRAFPPLLDPLTDPSLISLVAKYDKNLETTGGSGAANWTVLANRMTFIADLFRSSQCDKDMFDEPFTPEQRRDIQAGRIPTGPL